MTTINLHSFSGSDFYDLFMLIIKSPPISYKFIIPRNKNHSHSCPHFINHMEYTCAAYAFQRLSELSTDFSYTVPSVYKSKPFECCIETTEPEKLFELIYWLLGAYNPNFAIGYDEAFPFEAAEFFRVVFEDEALDVAAWGLMAVGWDELEKWLRGMVGEEE